MKKRELYLDVLRVLALIFMVCIHSYEIVVNSEIMSESFNMEGITLFVEIIYSVSPTVFMFCMGASLSITKKNDPIKLVKRGLKLLLVGLVLNIIRGSVFLVFGSDYYFEFLLWIVGSDILFFAGLYNLLFGLFRKLKLNDNVIMIITILMNIVSSLFIPVVIEDTFVAQVMGNFVYCDYDSIFPITLWAIYPTIGYYLTNKLEASKDKDKLYCDVGLVSLVLLTITIVVLVITNKYDPRFILWGEMDYMMDIPTTIITVGIMLVYVPIVFFLSKLIKSEKVSDYISGVASKLTTIYFIHWVILMGCFLVFCLGEFEASSTAFIYLLAIIVLIISTLLAWVVKKVSKR